MSTAKLMAVIAAAFGLLASPVSAGPSFVDWDQTPSFARPSVAKDAKNGFIEGYGGDQRRLGLSNEERRIIGRVSMIESRREQSLRQDFEIVRTNLDGRVKKLEGAVFAPSSPASTPKPVTTPTPAPPQVPVSNEIPWWFWPLLLLLLLLALLGWLFNWGNRRVGVVQTTQTPTTPPPAYTVPAGQNRIDSEVSGLTGRVTRLEQQAEQHGSRFSNHYELMRGLDSRVGAIATDVQETAGQLREMRQEFGEKLGSIDQRQKDEAERIRPLLERLSQRAAPAAG